jgi:hypothetical protein
VHELAVGIHGDGAVGLDADAVQRQRPGEGGRSRVESRIQVVRVAGLARQDSAELADSACRSSAMGKASGNSTCFQVSGSALLSCWAAAC